MLLAVDMGNTNIVVGCIEGDSVAFIERISTDRGRMDVEYASLLHMVMQIHKVDAASIDGAIMSSVVPPLTSVLASAIKKITGLEPMIVGAGIKTGLNIRIDTPSELGADLVADSVAALHRYGAPCIVIDMGTATTVTVIDKNRDYIGGVILPGVRSSLDSLVTKASKLPNISLETPKRCIGKNTVECMQGGIIYGQAAQLDGLISRFEEELGYPCRVVATGGLAHAIVPCCRSEITLDDDLMLYGLQYIYEKNAR